MSDEDRGRPRAFPDGFVWGVATSAYQVEGAAREDGRGESIWDRFSHTPGRIADGSNGDVASDHYHRWREDVAIMAELGVRAYRFSIAWPRVVPTGAGPTNAAGLAFYDRLVDGLLEAGITPLPTLFHWDLPQALQDRGGWLSRDTVARFAEYAARCFEGLGDRVGTWLTINEPAVAAFHGHEIGVHAPGMHDQRSALIAAHHLLLAHGEAVGVFRGLGQAGRIGIPLNLWPMEPATEAEADREAARLADGRNNRWFLDAILRGAYPHDLLELHERIAGPLDFVNPGDAAVIARPIDLLGVNYYSRSIVLARHPNSSGLPAGRTTGADTSGSEGHERGGYEMPWQALPPAATAPVTEMGWEVVPGALTELLISLHREYGVPLMVTENGAAYRDEVAADGSVDDGLRVRYLRAHLAATHRAIEAGVPVEGYLWWSLMDNFEWAEGYTKRFGLVHVDYTTQRRTIKASGRAFAAIAGANAVA